MKEFAGRRPVLFCLAVTLALFALTALSRVLYPSAPVGDLRRVPQSELQPPSGMDRVLDDLQSPDVLFWVFAIGLAAGLLAALGRWEDAGFNKPGRWKNLRLLWFPVAVGGLAVSGGVFVGGPDALVAGLVVVVVAVFGEELLFRGVMWRVLAPAGPVHAVLVTSLLSGGLILFRDTTDGPWPEAVRVTILALCGGFTYGALRWRTRSIWPVIFAHVLFAFAMDVSTLGTVTYRLIMLLSTLGFVAYGLFLLRSSRVRADGGLPKEAPPRVR